MANKDQLSRTAAGLQAMQEGLDEMIYDAASDRNMVLVGLLGALKNHTVYIQASVAVAAEQLTVEKPRHPLDIWKKDSNN